MVRILSAAFFVPIAFGYSTAQTAPQLDLPRRSATALTGSEFAAQIEKLPLQEREERVYREVLAGNVPDFLLQFVPVDLMTEIGGNELKGRIFVAPDYLAVGSDADYLLIPMTPFTAQRIASQLHCTLPTPKMSDSIYAAATVKLTPSPIPPTPAMTTVPVFVTHNRTVLAMRQAIPARLGALTAGDKKDIVICRALADTPGKVAIYGWHKPNGQPIQPLYLGHTATWADYSHGVRLVADTMFVNGKERKVVDVLEDAKLSVLLSSEGPVKQPSYVFHHFPVERSAAISLPPGERLETFSPLPGVRVVIDRPETLLNKVRLVLFALPNGNTVEQTFGRKADLDDDWHYDIQHIGAQTRFLRPRFKDESLVVAYLEANNHAWPAWLHGSKAGPNETVTIVDAILARFAGHDLHVVLDSHSGGGAFIFDYIKTVNQIPYQIDRIAFLDSEYNYDASTHLAKIVDWLRGPNKNLCVIAYDDASALYQGKPFVSVAGGTWGRSHAMLKDLGGLFGISHVGVSDPGRYEGLSGRITFLLKQNPTHAIFHTVQVERNGFIESLLSGTSDDEVGYSYFGQRAYAKFIRD